MGKTKLAGNSGGQRKMPTGRPFPKGVSGNPSGRPKEYREVVALAREKSAAAIATLAEIMTNTELRESARVKAAEVLLDRGYGKAPQTVNINTDAMSDEELFSEARAIIMRREEATH